MYKNCTALIQSKSSNFVTLSIIYSVKICGNKRYAGLEILTFNKTIKIKPNVSAVATTFIRGKVTTINQSIFIIFCYSWVSRGYCTMADGGQIMRFKLDFNEILLYNWPPCAMNWNLMKPTCIHDTPADPQIVKLVEADQPYILFLIC